MNHLTILVAGSSKSKYLQDLLPLTPVGVAGLPASSSFWWPQIPEAGSRPHNSDLHRCSLCVLLLYTSVTVPTAPLFIRAPVIMDEGHGDLIQTQLHPQRPISK